ncbi:MAG: type I-D CRISPR-associated protein Cas7/Csc2 [Gammaproteobacteria bacterium]|nr:type I-D CRISPR-associated protein Cas7/Csc2 [Gammaproteobacteria bacterium]
MTQLEPFLGSLDTLISTAQGSKKEYVMPVLKNLGSVTIPLIREIIAPAAFRNEQQDITDIDDASGIRRVRAVANKFKYGERQRGLQILRYFGAGGSCPQNRTELPKGQTAGSVFDLNTIVFGDSTDVSNKVLPVKASALYTDAVSLLPYADCVGKTFHNRAAEDGTLFDAETKKNSSNLFERYFLKPGTLLVQTVTFNGRTAPVEAVKHFLLCVGLAGAYGGQTSIYGINVRNHIAGIYGAPLERDITSPYVLVDTLGERDNSNIATEKLANIFYERFPISVEPSETSGIVKSMMNKLENNDTDMRKQYVEGSKKISSYFDAWFEGIVG